MSACPRASTVSSLRLLEPRCLRSHELIFETVNGGPSSTLVLGQVGRRDCPEGEESGDCTGGGPEQGEFRPI
jgi:hypothetical protein